jgi:hypothetical protein
LLLAPASVSSAPGATAICVPRLARAGAVVGRGAEPLALADEIAGMKRGRLSAPRHAQYRAGEVVIPAGSIDAAKVFPRGGRVDLEHLGLLLVDIQHAETLAPYLAIIRHGLGMPPSANALLALEMRLYPADTGERPPARAPGIARLRKTLKGLAAGKAPDITLDVLAEDLRFLRLFERTEHVLKRGALDRLLADVVNPTSASPPRAPARIIKLHRRGDA